MVSCIVAFVVGVCAALFFPFVLPNSILPYTSVLVLYFALGTAEAIRLILIKKLNLKIFISGFFCGLVFVFLFIMVGKKLDLDIYPVSTLFLSIGLVKSCIGIFKYFIGKNLE